MSLLGDQRVKLGWTQEEAALRLRQAGLPVSRSMVSHWENGRYALPFAAPKQMKIIASVFGLSVSDLLKSAGYLIGGSADEAIFHVGKMIKERRTTLGMTQERLAELLETDQRRISKYENGTGEPSLRMLRKLALALQCTSDYLLGLEKNDAAQP